MSAATVGAGAVDTAVLDRLCEVGEGRLLRKLLVIYRDNGPERMGRARAGLAAGDLSEVEQAVHSLKSSSGNLGALALHSMCETVELLAAAGDAGAVARRWAALEQEFDGVYRELMRRLDGLPE